MQNNADASLVFRRNLFLTEAEVRKVSLEEVIESWPKIWWEGHTPRKVIQVCRPQRKRYKELLCKSRLFTRAESIRSVENNILRGERRFRKEKQKERGGG